MRKDFKNGPVRPIDIPWPKPENPVPSRRVGLSKGGGPYLPLRGVSGPKGVAKAFRGPSGFKESQALQNKILKKFKKTIKKTPDKIIPKPQKKKIIQAEQITKSKNPAGSRAPWTSPIKLRKGGKV